MRLWLSGEETSELARNAYAELLRQLNPLIVKDAMDRIAGKPVERVEATGAEGERLIPKLEGAALTEFIDLLRAAKGKK